VASIPELLDEFLKINNQLAVIVTGTAGISGGGKWGKPINQSTGSNTTLMLSLDMLSNIYGYYGIIK